MGNLFCIYCRSVPDQVDVLMQPYVPNGLDRND